MRHCRAEQGQGLGPRCPAEDHRAAWDPDLPRPSRHRMATSRVTPLESQQPACSSASMPFPLSHMLLIF